MSNYRTEELVRFANAFKALSNPHRLQIFNLLSNHCKPGEHCQVGDGLCCCVGDLMPKLDIAPSTLSHHLKELNQAGLIEMTRQGKQIFCSVNTFMLKEMRMLFKFYEMNNKQAERSLHQEKLI